MANRMPEFNRHLVVLGKGLGASPRSTALGAAHQDGDGTDRLCQCSQQPDMAICGVRVTVADQHGAHRLAQLRHGVRIDDRMTGDAEEADPGSPRGPQDAGVHEPGDDACVDWSAMKGAVPSPQTVDEGFHCGRAPP